jgi:hypothetical protein
MESIAINFLIASATMGFIYWAAIAWVKNREPNLGNNYGSVGWGLGELLYGAVLWSPMIT